ncbi:creatininase family protein [Streptomyces sp. 549]|uniref:creatininase family protein n=1 Tax=Streptomyces sp. 549 TaxID=3049076 RepID=UPI0024C33686|nr:creatininase family protein [Streptomyces sp. 549]MDK1476872.1 creatininase family protein [Streptomyces sp. 549]
MSDPQERPRGTGLLPLESTGDVGAMRPAVAVLPIGSFEQHGPFLPLTTDTLIACAIAREIAAAYPVLRLPPLTVSCSHEHFAWPGTVSISATTLVAVVRDIAESLRRSGIRSLVLVNGHGGNYVLRNVVQESAGTGFPMALFPGSADWSTARERAGVETSSTSDMHAGETETSILLREDPAWVRPGHMDSDFLADDREHLLTLGLRPYTESGVVGRPSLASAAKGGELLAALVDSFGAYFSLLTAERSATPSGEGAR